MDKQQLAESILNKYKISGYVPTSKQPVDLQSRFAEIDAIASGQTLDQDITNKTSGIKTPGIVRGLGKSALGLAQGAGELGQNILQGTVGRVVEDMTDVPKEDLGVKVFEKGTEQFKQVEQATIPETTGEKVGKFAGDVAQFIIPSTKVSKIQKGSSLVSKIIGQAVSDTVTQTVKEGELNKDVRDTAILSLAIPSIATGGKIAINKLLNKSSVAGRVINSLIKPAKNEFSYGKNPGKVVADEGIVANSLDELATKIDNTISNKSKEYINAIKKSGAVIDVTDAFGSIDDAIKIAVKQNNQGLVNRLNTIKVALTNNLDSVVDDAGNEIIKSTGVKQLDNLTAEELVTLKREIGDMTSFTGNPSDDKLVNKALKTIYGNIKSKIDSMVPGSSEMSEKIASLISAKTATINRVGLLERQNLSNFTGKVLGGAGALTSIFTANPIPALIGLGAGGLENAMSTPAFKTRLAKFLSTASKAQLKELYTGLPGARAIINREIGND